MRPRGAARTATLPREVAAVARTSFTERMLRAARFDEAVYEEVEGDTRATLQAGLVVVLGSIAAGLGSGARFGIVAALVSAFVALGAWSFYAWIAYFVGGTLLKGPQTRTSWGEIARTLGFANSPKLLLILAAIPGLALVPGLVFLWTVGTTIVALRAALDVTTGRAIAIAAISLVVQVVLTVFLVALQQSA